MPCLVNIFKLHLSIAWIGNVVCLNLIFSALFGTSSPLNLPSFIPDDCLVHKTAVDEIKVPYILLQLACYISSINFAKVYKLV